MIKQRLTESLPGVKTFLDVDDLRKKAGKGAELVSRSHAMLVFCSDGYFGGDNPPSRPSIMELIACFAAGIPIIAMLEVEEKHKPLSKEQLYRQMKRLDELRAEASSLLGISEEMSAEEEAEMEMMS